MPICVSGIQAIFPKDLFWIQEIKFYASNIKVEILRGAVRMVRKLKI